MFKKITIIGTGLIGGSIGLAIKKKRLAKEVWGVARHKATLNVARRNGAVDKATLDVKEAVKGADLVILATPVGTIIPILKKIKPVLKPGAIVTDAGSTKLEIVRIGEKLLKKNAHFIGSHPMAGSEKRGINSACSRLFDNSVTFVTRTAASNKSSAAKVAQFWRRLGTKVVFLSPDKHDRIMSRVSHLPHIVSSGLVNTLKKDDFNFIGSGFQGMSRLSSGDVLIWHDIALSNRKELIYAIKLLEKNLTLFRRALIRKDSKAIARFLSEAKRKKDNYSN